MRKEFIEHGIVQDDNFDGEDEDSNGYGTATEEEKEGHGIKMYLQKNGR